MEKGTKVAVFKSGYVKEDLTEVEPIFMQYNHSLSLAERFIRAHCSISNDSVDNYHTVVVKRYWNGWREIEGTEKHYIEEKL